MNYTTNFNLNKPEGTDLYNHLTIDNPNMDIIDGAMQANKLASIGAATELVSGTVHAITRSDSNQNIFKFKATGDFHEGDTFTVDGISVSAYTTAGQQLLEEAYVLSAEVICMLDGNNLWVLTNKVPDASEIVYDNNNTVKDVIDEIGYFNANINNAVISNITDFQKVQEVTLTPGVWIVKASCRITPSNSGRIGLAIVDSGTVNFTADAPDSVFHSCNANQGFRIECVKMLTTATTKTYDILSFASSTNEVGSRVVGFLRIK